MKHCHTLDLIAVILLLIGGINLGLVGLFNFDLIGAIFGEVISRILYVLIGISAIYRIVCWIRCKASK